jgi:uncharacterized protein Yka (UPF0111/DUF47 family)
MTSSAAFGADVRKFGRIWRTRLERGLLSTKVRGINRACRREAFMKTQVLEAIGETELERSGEVNAALEANDRLKYYFSLLQMAAAHADSPGQRAATLRHERLACGVDDAALDEIPAAARREGDGYKIPGWSRLREQITQAMRVMAAPVADPFEDRMNALLSALPSPQDDLLGANTIRSITQAGRGKTDSLHQLVMDIHKALNAMQAELAQEQLDGAAVYGIEDADRPRIAAFMSGLNRTAPLKFHHPGLGTTATRSGSRLVIQNDIGTTDAHVAVIHVEDLGVEVICTDIHPERLEFFENMLARYNLSWEAAQTGQLALRKFEGEFQLVRGHFQAKDEAELHAYLEFLGSRLVFLIDWNRARKELRSFLRGGDRVKLLAWAAETEVGHRGFLELGGARLVNNAIEATAGSAVHFGDRLCDVLGDEEAQSFLRFVLRTASEGLRDQVSPGLIQDRVRAELRTHFSSEGKRLLELASEHASMIFEISSLVRDGIQAIGSNGASSDGAGREHYRKLSRRARKFEHEADQIVTTGREAARRRPEYTSLFRMIEAADDAADELEESAFLLELLVETHAGGEVLEALTALSSLLVDAAQEWIKALGHAAHVSPAAGARTQSGGTGMQEDAGDFLTAVDSLFDLEHQADDAERTFTHAAVQGARDFRQLYLYGEMAQSLEAAADALKWAGLIARDYLLGSVLEA